MTVRCASASPAANRGSGKTVTKVPVLVEALKVTPIAKGRKSTGNFLPATPADRNVRDKKSATPTRLKKEDLKQKTSPPDGSKPKKGLEERAIKLWASSNAQLVPPPDHVPWESQLITAPKLEVETPKLQAGMKPLFLLSSVNSPAKLRARPKIPRINSLTSEIDLTTCGSAESLLRMTLPSVASMLSTAGVTTLTPPFCEVKTRHASTPLPAKKQVPISSAKLVDQQGRRYTVCFPGASSKREALVVGQSALSTLSELDNQKRKSISALAPPSTQATLNELYRQIQELTEYYSEGLREVNANANRLSGEQRKIEMPSLVVSTSTAVVPVSLESYTDLGTSVTLATRRGKPGPAPLTLNNKDRSDSPYSDCPFDLNVEHEFTEDEHLYFDNMKLRPGFPATQFTAEQMVTTLQSRVSSLLPRSDKSSDQFDGQCNEVEFWLSSEVTSGDVRFSSVKKTQGIGSLVQNNSRSPPGIPLPDVPIDPGNEVVLLKDMEKMKVDEKVGSDRRVSSSKLRFWQSRQNGTQPKPRQSIISEEGVTSDSSGNSSSPKKRVRFSDAPPLMIPDDNMDPSICEALQSGNGPETPQINRRKPPPMASCQKTLNQQPITVASRRPSLPTPSVAAIPQPHVQSKSEVSPQTPHPPSVVLSGPYRFASLPKPTNRRYTDSDCRPALPTATSPVKTRSFVGNEMMNKLRPESIQKPMISKPLPMNPNDKENVAPSAIGSAKVPPSSVLATTKQQKRASKSVKTRSLAFRGMLSRFKA